MSFCLTSRTSKLETRAWADKKARHDQMTRAALTFSTLNHAQLHVPATHAIGVPHQRLSTLRISSLFNQGAGMPLLLISLRKQLSISVSLKGFRSTGIFA